MNAVIPSEVACRSVASCEGLEESRCVTLRRTPRDPSTPLRFPRDDN
jgi:hypothetical protein